VADKVPPAEDALPQPHKDGGSFRHSLLGLPGLLALGIVLLDQLTKWLVVRAWPVPYGDELVIVPGLLKFVHWRNTGAAWGIFASHTWLLTLVSAVACLALVVGFNAFTGRKRLFAIPAGILLGGIAGNLIDRAFYAKGVIDFIRLPHFPAFNVADSAITCSIIFIIACELFCHKKDTNQ